MSTLLWAAYVAAVGSLAALAAWVVEPVVRALRWPTRWLWALAMAAQLAAVGVALGTAGARPASWFTAAWLVASCVAVAIYLRALRALRRERGEWRVTIAEEMPVWVSREMGPAVVGFLRSIVVAPAWAMALGDRERRLLLRHEGEHVAAWDPTLLLGALATCALVPWSPVAWWALARLRLAIEVDCDRRVLAHEPDVAAYGELLVAVQGRVVPGAAGLAAFAERRLPLEERIEAMTARRPRGAAWRWSARGAIASALVLAACMAPRPATTTISGLVDISADDMKVKRNADGTQTITAKNATITARPDTATQAGGAASRIIYDSELYAQLAAMNRALDSVMRSDSGKRTIDELNQILDGIRRAEDTRRTGDAPSQRELRRAREMAVETNRRAHALVHGILRGHFASPERRPAPNTITFVLLDSAGVVIGRNTVTRAELRSSNRSPNLTLTADDSTMRRFLPDAPANVPTGAAGITDGPIVGLDQSMQVVWWQLAAAEDASDAALRTAVERLFADRGGDPPADSAVGIVIAFDMRWKPLGVRRVPVREVPTTNMVPAAVRERLLPETRGLEVQGDGVMAGGGRWGLARGSVLHYWRMYDANDEAAAMARARRVVLDTVRAYARERGIDTQGEALRVNVLLASNWKVIGVSHEPLGTLARVLSPDSIVAKFAGVKDPTVLRSATSNPLPQLTALPAGSVVSWAQLSPPRIIRVEPRQR